MAKKKKVEKKNDLRFLMKSIHGLVDLSKFTEIDIENVYLTNGAEPFDKYVYFNGFDYIAINPFLYEVYGLDLKDENVQIQGVIPGVEINNPSMKKAIYEHKNRIKIMADEGRWVDVFSHIEKKVGLSVLIREFENIPDDQKYDCFIEIYTRSEFGFEILKEHYEKIFSFAHLSKEREKRIETLREKFGSEEFEIYHGASYDYPVFDYYSWTLNFDTASFFAFRYSAFGTVLDKTIKVENAIDYLIDRNEEEILFQPSKLFLELVFNNNE